MTTNITNSVVTANHAVNQTTLPTKKLDEMEFTTFEETDFEEPAVPDSTTTLEKERIVFSHGEDVLLKHKDGRYYLGTVVEIDYIRDQCLLRFGDNTESWASTKDLTKLSLPDEDLLCVVCKISSPKEKNDVVICDKCGRGYHFACHQPAISSDYKNHSNFWHCKKCVESRKVQSIHRVKVKKNRAMKEMRKICAGPEEVRKFTPLERSKLPYDPDMLNWDTYHRMNMEQVYCYCGTNGEWYTQMLQCGRCKQWFHEKCVSCLQFPLYCGDRFYVFVCSICNYGKEFVRRLEIKWVDMVHLMLFNLTAFNTKKYYDLDTVIIPYINDNWHALQLPPKISNVSKSERRENILSVLTNNRNRFKCGREIKKRTTIWGLRVRLPPPAPCVTLPAVGPISENELRERWHGNRRLQFLPLNNSFQEISSNSTNMIVPVDSVMLDLMMGVAYQDQSANKSESEVPSDISSDHGNDNFGIVCDSEKDRTLKNGFVPSQELNTPCDTSGDETSSKSTLDLIIPPPKDFEGKNNPFHNLSKETATSTPVAQQQPPKRLSLPLALTPVVPLIRTLKRQLSEKDICIGPNGEVKQRRRYRRTRSAILTASKNATVVPSRNDTRQLRSNVQPIANCVDYALNGRRLRQRHDKQATEVVKQTQNTSNNSIPSPVKSEPEINMDDLKSSVNIYFGAANRIALGEKFNIRACRKGPEGKLQYLVEWEGINEQVIT